MKSAGQLRSAQSRGMQRSSIHEPAGQGSEIVPGSQVVSPLASSENATIAQTRWHRMACIPPGDPC
jgi:hypothetical protein